MPVRMRPAFAIASMPSCGCEPCAARPAISISSHAKPLCAMQISRSVGSVTIAASARSSRATACVPMLANSSSQTAATTTSPARPSADRLRAGPQRGRRAALHVEAPAAVEPVALDARLERPLVAVVADRVGVAVEQQRAPAARPAGDADHVHAAGRDLVDAHLRARALEPGGDEARDLALPRTAGDEVGIDRVDRDQVADEVAQRHAAIVSGTMRAMRAARLTLAASEPRFEIQELPDPSPGPGEVVVELVTAALNRRDWWIWREPSTPVPVTLGSDGAGRVAEVGAGVSGIATGDEVVIDSALHWGDDEHAASEAFDILGSPTEGTFAERVVLPAVNVHPKPAGLGWEEAAAFPLAGLTAWRATVTKAGAAPGRRLLVTGGGSGVSTCCLQIAVALGARVWVTSGSDDKIARCVALGAEAGFRYDDEEWPQQVLAATGGEGVHAVIDSFGADGWAQAFGALARGGVIVNYGDTGGETATIPVFDLYWQWRSIIGTTMGSPREFQALCAHMETGAWRPAIDSVHELADIAVAARRLTEPERFGKVVLRIA